MSVIQTGVLSSYHVVNNQEAKKHSPVFAAGNFDALLASFDLGPKKGQNSGGNSNAMDILSMNAVSAGDSSDSIMGTIEGFKDNAIGSLNGMFNALMGKEAAADGSFPLTADFTSTFGTSGPLINFINRITATLGLSAEQNKALQAISVSNKDTDGSPASVQKIGQQLKEAGIG